MLRCGTFPETPDRLGHSRRRRAVAGSRPCPETPKDRTWRRRTSCFRPRQVAHGRGAGKRNDLPTDYANPATRSWHQVEQYVLPQFYEVPHFGLSPSTKSCRTAKTICTRIRVGQWTRGGSMQSKLSRRGVVAGIAIAPVLSATLMQKEADAELVGLGKQFTDMVELLNEESLLNEKSAWSDKVRLPISASRSWTRQRPRCRA